MDTHEWAYYADCSRLKSKRTKKRLQKKDRDKQLTQLRLESKRITLELRKPVYELLDEPYQRGWKRTFVLRPDQRRIPDAGFFETLLAKINTVVHSDRKDFKKKKRKNGRRIYVDKPQLLQEIEYYHLKKYEFTEREMSYFHVEQRYLSFWNCSRPVLVFNEPWRFVLKVSPHMITQVRVVDCDLLKRNAEIHRFLETRNLAPRMWKIWKGYFRYRYGWSIDPKYLKKPTKAELMAEAENEN